MFNRKRIKKLEKRVNDQQEIIEALCPHRTDIFLSCHDGGRFFPGPRVVTRCSLCGFQTSTWFTLLPIAKRRAYVEAGVVPKEWGKNLEKKKAPKKKKRK